MSEQMRFEKWYTGFLIEKKRSPTLIDTWQAALAATPSCGKYGVIPCPQCKGMGVVPTPPEPANDGKRHYPSEVGEAISAAPTPPATVPVGDTHETRLCAVLEAVRQYLPPGGISKDELISRVIAQVDPMPPTPPEFQPRTLIYGDVSAIAQTTEEVVDYIDRGYMLLDHTEDKLEMVDPTPPEVELSAPFHETIPVWMALKMIKVAMEDHNFPTPDDYYVNGVMKRVKEYAVTNKLEADATPPEVEPVKSIGHICQYTYENFESHGLIGWHDCPDNDLKYYAERGEKTRTLYMYVDQPTLYTSQPSPADDELRKAAEALIEYMDDRERSLHRVNEYMPLVYQLRAALNKGES